MRGFEAGHTPRPVERVKRVAQFVFNRFYSEPFPAMSDHWQPSERIDVGKSERAARGVQLVLEGMSGYNSTDVIDLEERRQEMFARLNTPDDAA